MANTLSASVRILVVDDFAPWRQYVCSMLQTRPEFHVVAEAADGLEAVHKAQEFQPDLILLDIGLPSLYGIEAAKRMRQIAPNAGIIFLTLHRDQDTVREGFRSGAQGYVLKTDAGNELIAAMEGVLRGDYFVSSGIKRGSSGEAETT